MKDGEPCTSRGVSTVLEGVTPRPRTKGQRPGRKEVWRGGSTTVELYTMQRYLQVYGTLVEKLTAIPDAWASAPETDRCGDSRGTATV